jgi:hypothetical protein
MIKHTPYTYLIGWPNLDKWYYGVRYAKNCSPNDLWVLYKTSSKLVKKFVDQHGEPTVIKVRKTFTSIVDAQNWESRVLKRLQVTKSTRWINAHDSKAFDPLCVPKGKDHWTNQNTKAAIRWRNREDWKKKKSCIMPRGDNHWTAKDTDAAKLHHLRMTGLDNPNNQPGVKEKKSNYLKENNPVFKENVREKISKSLLGKTRPRKICEHCQKDIADSVYTKYHGDKCQHRATAFVNTA